MNRVLAGFALLTSVAAAIAAGCGQGASPTPTAAPAKEVVATVPPASTKAPEAARVDFPTKGKAISMIIPWAAGGGSDLGSRLLAVALEKQFGTPVQPVNKTGASSQVGITELMSAKPDGYTIAHAVQPNTILLYLDPERQVTFGRKDFVPVGTYLMDNKIVSVLADSPYKTLKDLVDAAKAKPEGIKIGAAGVRSVEHLAILQLQKETGTKFTIVQFDSGANGLTAMLGGHIDVWLGTTAQLMGLAKDQKIRLLASLDRERSSYFPDVKTAEEQGVKVFSVLHQMYIVPPGTPKAIIDVYAQAIKKAADDPDQKAKVAEMGQRFKYMTPDEANTFWDQHEADLKAAMALASAQ